MSITYKTVLAEAVRGYNNIQTALSVNKDITNVNIKDLSVDGSNVSNLNTASQMVTAINVLTTKSAVTISGGTISVPKSTVTLEKGETTNNSNGKNITSSLTDKGTSEPSSGYYFAIKGTSSAVTATGSGLSATINTKGFLGATSQITFPSQISGSNSSSNTTEYFAIPASTCSRTNIVTSSSNTSGISIIHNAGYIETSTLYVASVNVESNKTFTVNNSGSVTINNNTNNMAGVTATTIVETVDCQILVENNKFDIKNSSGTSLLASIDGLLTSIENILGTPAGSDNEVVTIVNNQTTLIDEIESLLA